MIVTIDGPAGAGKSTASRALATRLGFGFLDTGAMYRAVALAALRAGVSLDETGLAPVLAVLHLEMPTSGTIRLNGEDVVGLLRSPEVTATSSVVATLACVRTCLVRLQRQVAVGQNLVTEGRDQGTVVFPDAGCKFFLTADPVERARRRQAELTILRGGEGPSLSALLTDMATRDERDASREVGPLRPAVDAIVLDTTHLSLADVVVRMETAVRRLTEAPLEES